MIMARRSCGDGIRRWRTIPCRSSTTMKIMRMFKFYDNAGARNRIAKLHIKRYIYLARTLWALVKFINKSESFVAQLLHIYNSSCQDWSFVNFLCPTTILLKLKIILAHFIFCWKRSLTSFAGVINSNACNRGERYHFHPRKWTVYWDVPVPNPSTGPKYKMMDGYIHIWSERRPTVNGLPFRFIKFVFMCSGYDFDKHI